MEAPQTYRRFKRKVDDVSTYDDVLATHSQCQYYLERKRRFCGVARSPDSQFCGNHAALVQQLDRERIPCPVDPSHTIYKDSMAKHIKCCNIARERRELENMPYYCLDCNSGDPDPEEMSSNHNIDTMIDPDALMAKVLKLYESLGATIAIKAKEPAGTGAAASSISPQEKLIEETVIAAVAPAQSSSGKQIRHARQDALIAHEMLKAGLLFLSIGDQVPKEAMNEASRTVYIELGAGRGVLGQAVSSVCPSSSLVLVERAGQRRKADTQMRAQAAGRGVRYGPFCRLRMDIRHCRLSGLPPFEKRERPLDSNDEEQDQDQDKDQDKFQSSMLRGRRAVLIAKHLCGVATDLALRALTDLDARSAVSSRGLCMATCCHHACQWNDYVGRTWLQQCGFTCQEFDVMKLWSSWAFALGSTRVAASNTTDTDTAAQATLGEKASEQEQEQEQEQEHQLPASLSSSVVRPTNLTREQMANCGHVIKRLFDHGRVLYVRQALGLGNCRVVQYCHAKDSPECYLLLASDSGSDLVSDSGSGSDSVSDSTCRL